MTRFVKSFLFVVLCGFLPHDAFCPLVEKGKPIHRVATMVVKRYEDGNPHGQWGVIVGFEKAANQRCYNIFGGQVDKGDKSVAQAAARELHEESAAFFSTEAAHALLKHAHARGHMMVCENKKSNTALFVIHDQNASVTKISKAQADAGKNPHMGSAFKEMSHARAIPVKLLMRRILAGSGDYKIASRTKGDALEIHGCFVRDLVRRKKHLIKIFKQLGVPENELS